MSSDFNTFYTESKENETGKRLTNSLDGAHV